MDKKIFIGKKNVIGVIIAIMAAVIFLKTASADTVDKLWGCPKDETIMAAPGKCSDDSEASIVKEGYYFDRQYNISVLNTLTPEEKKKWGVRNDNKIIIVIYSSPNREEVSFTPGKDKSGNNLVRSAFEIKYGCGGVSSSKKLNKNCVPLGDKSKKNEKLKSRKDSLNATLSESKPIFYKQHKEMGYSKEDIDKIWKHYEEMVYKEYNYDPQAKTFKD